MNSNLRVSLIQSRLQWRSPADNRSHLEDLLHQSEASDLYVLPETFTTGFLGETRETDEAMSGETVRWMQSLSEEFQAAICGSAVIEDAQGRRNRFLLTQPSQPVAFYDKRHLFSFAGENKRYVAGDRREVFDLKGWRLSPQICYDLRFPVWCRVQDDFDVMVFVANWPAPRVTAWDALLRARAIENQCYVVAVNRVGEDGNGVQYPGHSAIYGPLGEVIIEPWEDEGTRSADIQLAEVQSVRQKFPFANEADDFTLAGVDLP